MMATNMHRNKLLVVTLALLMACIFVPSACMSAEVSPSAVLLEQRLDELAEKGLPGPLVAALWVRTADMKPKETPESLRELAESFELGVFEEAGITVIGPSQRRDFSSMLSDPAQPMQSAKRCSADLLQSLSEAQWRMIASGQGLALNSLNGEQVEIVKRLFARGKVVYPVWEDGSLDGTRVVAAEEVPLKSGKVFAWIALSDIGFSIKHPDGRHGSSGGYGVATESPLGGSWQVIKDQRNWKSGYDSLWYYGWPQDQEEPPLIPNTLKESDLDYSSSALDKPVSSTGKTNVRDLIALIAGQTGLNLHASPGSDQVRLFTSLSNIPASSVLKAVSLATTGTWRRVGSGYLFTFDKAGIGQIRARLRESAEIARMQEAGLEDAWDSLLGRMNLLKTLPFLPGSPFTFTPAQLDDLAKRSADPYGENRGLPWSALSSEQQGFIKERLASKMPSDTSLMSVRGGMGVRLEFEFPGMSRVFAPRGGDEDLSVFRRHSAIDVASYSDAPSDLRLPLTTPLKGCIWKPAKSDTPKEIVDTIERYGFNTLYLRVFADGYTAFPSSRFPLKGGLDADFLQRVISLAHGKGIEVYGVVDVLRWSDGSKGHWLSKRTDLLDYDILGRTHGQLLGMYGTPPGYEGALEKVGYGEALTGDGVTPFSDEVRSKLQGLFDDLAEYDLDGLVLDHVSMTQGMLRIGMLGHNREAREGFLGEHGADSIDVPPSSRFPSMSSKTGLGSVPLEPVVFACFELSGKWDDYYRRGCDDLVDLLIKQWSKVKSDKPVWISGIPGLSKQPTHDWSRFSGRVAGMLHPITYVCRECAEKGVKAIPVIRACEDVGTLLFATALAEAGQQKLPNTSEETLLHIAPAKDGIVIDLTSAGRKKTSYLRLIRASEP